MRNRIYPQIVPKGELAARGLKNFARLHDRWYRPGIAGYPGAESPGWPGDWEGRSILALTLLSSKYRLVPAYLDELVMDVLSRRNEFGYRGELMRPGAINEQSLSGHSWLLRGLCEYYMAYGKKEAYEAIARIIENLFLPLRGKWKSYPIDKKEREHFADGKAAGELTGQIVNGWLLSSDTGCAFMSLDGLAQSYELLRIPELAALIGEMIARYIEIDYVAMTMQTHAALTASRGMLRMAEIFDGDKYCEHVKKVFQIYQKKGMTENYANYNWFGDPKWTEPCGIVDSYMIAMQLWEKTGDEHYLQQAQLIWHNGVERGQRPNGGFGCDNSVTEGMLHADQNFYEAYWCCTMRGAEGLSCRAENGAYLEEETLVVPYLSSGMIRFEQKALALCETTDYPIGGNAEFLVEEYHGPPISMKIYSPSWASDIRLALNGDPIGFSREGSFTRFSAKLKAGDRFRLSFAIPLRISQTVTDLHAEKGLHRILHGDLVLGTEETKAENPDISSFAYLGNGAYEWEGARFAPINMAYLCDEQKLKSMDLRILFR